MAEPWIDAHSNGTEMPSASQLLDHPGRSNVRHHALAQHDVQSVVAIDVAREHDHGRVHAAGEAGTARAENFVAARGVEPESGVTHEIEDGAGGVRLHGVAA